MVKQQAERRMLVDIGEIAGMVAVAIAEHPAPFAPYRQIAAAVAILVSVIQWGYDGDPGRNLFRREW
jgi:hypothetical protein